MLGSNAFNFIDIFIGGGLLVLIVFILTTIISNKRNGIKVLATITDIQEEEATDSDGNYYTKYNIMCSCDYEGIEEGKLYYNYKLDYKKLKPGDKIDCIYDKKKKYFTTNDNIKGTIIILIVLIIILLGFIMIDLFPKILDLFFVTER